MAGGGFVEPVLDEAENVLGIFFGGHRQWGGKLIVTNQRLLFSALDLGAIPDALVYVGGKAGIPGVDIGKTILDRVQASVGKDIWLRHITNVEADGNGSLFAPPSIRISTATGEVMKIGIVKSTTAMNVLPENRVHRDNAIALIRDAVEKAKSLG
jgi:hypothetical protein